MAETRGCWGIEIGQAGLKALRIQEVEGSTKAVATAFDYVPHAKILSQPDAMPDELIAHALDTFLSRNDVRGDLVALSVPAQQTLIRFIQLPPVEQGKVAQIVSYEAKQQIPFALEDAVWDYQTLGGADESTGYLLDAEVGIFAIKKEQLASAMKPLLDRKVEIEVVQSAAVALYNFLCYDRLKDRPDEPFEAADEYTVLCEMGADNTVLVVTNGAKIWTRVVPIGGNHFTRSLVKDMKLTFAKAEHLKCNATKSPDPKAVFQAMRPVFNDYVTEIQRSVGYFSSVNRNAKIKKVLGVGNGFKLAGLQKFLQQNLQQYPVERVERFEQLVGEKVLGDAVFQENILGFVVPYGLAVQAMGQTRLRTTLLPPEIATARMVRRKKPWAALTAASLLGLLALSAFGYGNVVRSVSESRFGDAEKDVADYNTLATTMKGKYEEVKTRYTGTEERAGKLIGNLNTRMYWPEVYRAINECLPRDTGAALDAADLTKKNRIRVSSITAQRVPDTGLWFTGLTPSQRVYLPQAEAALPPAGPGYIFTLQGQHFHSDETNEASQNREGYIKETLLKNLHQWVLTQPGSMQPVPVEKLGISHATIMTSTFGEVLDPRAASERPADDATPFGIARGAGTGLGSPLSPSSGMGAGPAGAHEGGSARSMTRPGAMMNPAMRSGPGGSHDEGAMVGGAMGGGVGRGLPPGIGGTSPGVESKYKPIVMTTFTIQFVWRPVEHDTRLAERPPLDEAAVAAAAEAAATAQQAAPATESHVE